ncbi:Deoxyadenosine/deoxycytidine kinase [Gracilibacillus halophilus YIM-C55.5]|uniref:Deoxyadenosine/deoxycytidine kinase n=1 Tax=Gracilibacillus halophilus YIM-C55.5 TaxID=1308866 RepID=N4WA18_9BACI|nr:deoxynucleoside kinase [Gracilibacillus halophilus]ENH96094.1 Deoxyadenosine/deoxycytidine kinase [Gracilibacillus halophilus YIM-C55.5]
MYHIPKDSIITVSGTVGVGKTTMTKTLAKALQFKTSLEEVDTNPYLEKFYQDFERWSFHLQVYFLGQRFKKQQQIAEAGGGYVQDRSIYEDHDIFARMHYDKGTMTPTDYHTYYQLFESMVMTPYFYHPDLLIFLDGSFDDILARIKQRGRDMEVHTATSYWREMYERYQEWIENFDACPVLRIDINEYDLTEDPQSIDQFYKR